VLARTDVSRGIPFHDSCFKTIICNSSLEHVQDIERALDEINRVLGPGGKLYTTFASHYAYEWWPCGRRALDRYVNFQPVYHRYSLQEWKRLMREAGLRIVEHQHYLSKNITRVLMFLDYHFSRAYMTSDRTLARPLLRAMRRVPRRIWGELWTRLFARIGIAAEDKGGGILIVAERVGTR
jgi:SAM-dependent methyltransferase